MSVVPLTLTISLCLVFTFVVFFIREQSRRRFGSPESDALLPLADEVPRASGASVNASPVVLELGGRLPAKRRKPCGGSHKGEHGCHDCEHRHEHGHKH